MPRKSLLSLGIAIAALASIAVFAQKGGPSRDDVIEAVSPDLPTGARKQQRIQAQRALAANRASAAPKIAARAAGPAPEDVYDVDSFKRSVTYLGLASAFINLNATCPTDPANPDELCAALNPAPAFTNFNFPDAARIVLPAKSSHSILCYWFSPLLTINYVNNGASLAYGRLRYSPTLTIENPVLDDPALIDPTTGAPFGGQLLTSMSSSESFVQPLDPGVNFTERSRDSTVCMAGFVSKKALIDNYGLTEAQATKFFNKPTTIRLNVSGAAQNVGFASMVFGLRVMGDER